MANLVEIVAKHVKEWPKDAVKVYQRRDGQMYAMDAEKWAWEICVTEQADDFLDAEVTREQWEAERARIASNQQATQDAREIVQGESKRSKEDRALWDKAFLDSQKMIFDAAGDRECLDDIAYRVGKWVDAFMAERAKRLDNSRTTNSTT